MSSTVRKTGNEEFKNINKKLKLLDFWSWAHSNIIENIERGKLAEYVIATAIDHENIINEKFLEYDLITKENIKIEVKSSSYIQSWSQKNHSKIIFNISKTYRWDSMNNKYENFKRRQADVYVFCLLKHKEQSTLNPLDVNQWEFYIASTKLLNKQCKENKTISLSKLQNIGAVKCNYNDIYHTVRILNNNNRKM